MPPRGFGPMMIVIPLLLTACIALPSFKDDSELVDGWYHRYEPKSWETKGARAKVVASILSEIENATGKRRDPDLFDTVIAYGPGNWVFEWSSAGEEAMERATRQAEAGQRSQSAGSYKEALAYFTTASWPHLGREDDRRALARARTAYMAAGQFSAQPVEYLTFPVGELSSKGYLHLPTGEGPFPVLILTYGSDVTKEDAFNFFESELEHRKIALFAVDLPGIGEASHIPLLEGSDRVLNAASDFLKLRSEIRRDAIFLAGASFGGNAAARAFFNNRDTAGVIYMCGPLHSAFMAPAWVYDLLPALTIDGVKARLGLLDQPNSELTRYGPGLSLKKQGLYESARSIDTPLLVLTTNKDPVAPLDDLEPLYSVAENVDIVILDQVGHCAKRRVRQPIVARWVADRVIAMDQ